MEIEVFFTAFYLFLDRNPFYTERSKLFLQNSTNQKKDTKISFSDWRSVRIELVFHTENSMKYQSLYTILKYRFNIPFRYEIPIFCS
jgi:hypothetical protein